MSLFWRSEEERDKLLKGTGIPEAVKTDLKKLQDEYNNIVLPFMKSHPDLWDPEKHTLELYKSLVAFVMAYRWDICELLNFYFITLFVIFPNICSVFKSL